MALLFALGLKLWAVCCITGYCFVNSVEGGFRADPAIRRWANDPLGRTTRNILYVLFHACPVFSEQVRHSGIHIAMDNYFTSPLLFQCLLAEKIFCIDTVRKNKAGLGGAFRKWSERGKTALGDYEMVHFRWGEMVFIRWKDSREVLLLSTATIFEEDQIPIEYK